MYKVIVFVKQVPDTKNVTGDAMKPDGTVNRAALPAIFNPEDLNAVELALQIKDNYQDVKVVVATMGPPNAAKVLRDAMCMGADEAVLLTDRAFAGSDTLRKSSSDNLPRPTSSNVPVMARTILRKKRLAEMVNTYSSPTISHRA